MRIVIRSCQRHSTGPSQYFRRKWRKRNCGWAIFRSSRCELVAGGRAAGAWEPGFGCRAPARHLWITSRAWGVEGYASNTRWGFGGGMMTNSSSGTNESGGRSRPGAHGGVAVFEAGLVEVLGRWWLDERPARADAKWWSPRLGRPAQPGLPLVPPARWSMPWHRRPWLLSQRWPAPVARPWLRHQRPTRTTLTG